MRVGRHPPSAHPDRHRRGLAGEPDRARGVVRVDGPQRRRATEPVHRPTSGGDRGLPLEIWEMYRDPKAYRWLRIRRVAPPADGLARCRWSARGEGRAEERLPRVLDQPAVPFHNNLSEGHVRDDAKKRTISGSTRSAPGRAAQDAFASLKKARRRRTSGKASGPGAVKER